MLWDVPEVQNIEASANVHARVSDLCAFGTPWKKPTKLLVGNVDFADAEGLALRCTGRGGCCSTSGAKHVLLEGPGADGKPRTRTAQEYPKRLCTALAWALISPLRNAHIAQHVPRWRTSR